MLLWFNFRFLDYLSLKKKIQEYPENWNMQSSVGPWFPFSSRGGLYVTVGLLRPKILDIRGLVEFRHLERDLWPKMWFFGTFLLKWVITFDESWWRHHYSSLNVAQRLIFRSSIYMTYVLRNFRVNSALKVVEHENFRKISSVFWKFC